jgi:hypothetical protein
VSHLEEANATVVEVADFPRGGYAQRNTWVRE